MEFTRKLEELNKGQSVNSAMFDKGMVAFCPMKFSEYRTYKPYPWRVKKYTNFEWDCIPMPAGPKGDNVSQLDTLSMGISASSSHKKLAWEFLKSLCYDQVISVADSEIRRLLGTDEDIKTSINTLQTKIDLILKK